MPISRRRWLWSTPAALWSGLAVQAQPTSEMSTSNPETEQGEVQVGAGTQAGVTTGSSGPQKKDGAKKDSPRKDAASSGRQEPATRGASRNDTTARERADGSAGKTPR